MRLLVPLLDVKSVTSHRGTHVEDLFMSLPVEVMGRYGAFGRAYLRKAKSLGCVQEDSWTLW